MSNEISHCPNSSPSDITQLIADWRAGSAAALNALLPKLYGELRQLAASHLRGNGDRTLQPTALVNEVMLRLLDASSIHISDRKHFFTTAAKLMRQILWDAARAKARDKRGGDWQRAELSDAQHISSDMDTTSPALHEALAQLERLDPRMAHIVELRYFGGLEVSEVASLLELDERTVYRDWAMAKAWLKHRLQL